MAGIAAFFLVYEILYIETSLIEYLREQRIGRDTNELILTKLDISTLE